MRSHRSHHHFALIALGLALSPTAAQFPKNEHKAPVARTEFPAEVRQAFVSDFQDWTHVWMYYCSSDAWQGRVDRNIRQASKARTAARFSGFTLVDKINTRDHEMMPCVRQDGLEMYFVRRSGSKIEVRVTTRRSLSLGWNPDLGGGSAINTPNSWATFPWMTSDGLSLYFARRPAGAGDSKDRIYVTRRAALDKPWQTAVLAPATARLTVGTSAPLALDNGNRLVFRYLNKSGKYRWAQANRDAKTGTWSGVEPFPEMLGPVSMTFDEGTGDAWQIMEVNGKSRLFRAEKHAPPTRVHARAVSKVTKISYPTMQRALYVPGWDLPLGVNFELRAHTTDPKLGAALYTVSGNASANSVKWPGIANPLIVDLSRGGLVIPVVRRADTSFRLPLRVPNDAKFLGAELHVQGAAFDKNTGTGALGNAATLRVVR